jgi:hypothetical protein
MKKGEGKKPRRTPAKRYLDCAKMKHRIQAKIYEETKGMTHAQEIEYFRTHAEQGPWGDWWREVHARESVVREKPAARGSSPKTQRRNRR